MNFGHNLAKWPLQLTKCCSASLIISWIGALLYLWSPFGLSREGTTFSWVQSPSRLFGVPVSLLHFPKTLKGFVLKHICFLLFQECNGHRVSASVPRVLVGNKCDLVDQIQVCMHKDFIVVLDFIHQSLFMSVILMSPQVPSNTALKFADAHNMLLFETSAKDPKESQNVDSIFMSLACRLKAQKSLLYRDVEREEGKVRLSQETETKSSCPCWGDWEEPLTRRNGLLRVVKGVWWSVFKADVIDQKKMVALFRKWKNCFKMFFRLQMKERKS